MRTRVFGLLLLMAGGIMFAQTSTTKGLSITVNASPSPTGNLLTGQTPAHYTVPTGWSLLATQDFEGGVNSPQYLGGGDTISSTISHSGTGTHSLGWLQTSTFGLRWGFSQGHLGSASETYTSWYQRLDSTAWMNTEFYLWRAFINDTGNSGGVVLDWFPNPGSNAVRQSNPILVSCPDWGAPFYAPTCNNQSGSFHADGNWHQYEVDFKPSTGGAANGHVQVWEDGVSILNLPNYNTSGTGNLTDYNIEIGGHMTLTVGIPNSVSVPTSVPPANSFACASYGNQAGFQYPDWSGAFTNGIIPFNSNFCTSGGYFPAPNFNYHIDDVIVLKR